MQGLIFCEKKEEIYMGRVIRKRTIIAYANNKGSDEPAHSHSLVRTYAVRSRKRQAGETSTKELDMRPR